MNAATRRNFHALKAKDVEKAMKGQLPDGRHGDGQGLSLQVRNNGGAASFVFVTNPPLPAKQRQYSIGSVMVLARGCGDPDVYTQAAYALKMARAAAAKMRENIANGMPARKAKAVARTVVTLQNIVDYYCEQKSVPYSKIQKYVEPYRAIVKANVDGVFNRDMSLQYRDKLLKTLKPVTVKTNLKMLSAMFSLYIIDKESDMRNPFLKVSVQDAESEMGRRDPMPIETIKAVRANLKGDYQTIWNLLTLSGARLGEIVGIKSADVLDNGFLRIESNDKRTLKNASSRRIIPTLIDLPKRESEYYFEQTVNAATAQLSKVIRTVTPDTKITTHSLRHSVTDKLREGNVQTEQQDMYLGHAPNSIAAKTYGGLESRAKVLAQNINPVMKAYASVCGIEFAGDQEILQKSFDTWSEKTFEDSSKSDDGKD
ncbi:MAG: hypothetical protein JWS10_2149 [Cypionkella sp.]|uniref:integrase arm-type DNA-binding domain-containing protein n=1 Tax=Cypionkella sp. TaxID=2811411 RepID=UPI002609915D|nr:integrase arm-type DNA-binding domain-containing protein [Cypionkella sp.]MDB5659534.1 hypothetical protein [Cypionkella sp.]